MKAMPIIALVALVSFASFAFGQRDILQLSGKYADILPVGTRVSFPANERIQIEDKAAVSKEGSIIYTVAEVGLDYFKFKAEIKDSYHTWQRLTQLFGSAKWIKNDANAKAY